MDQGDDSMEYSANISMLFANLPFLDRVDAAARAGFKSIEFWWPPASALEGGIGPLVRRVHDAGLRVGLINFYAGDMPAGDRGLPSDLERYTGFRENVSLALELAGKLGCRRLNALAGNVASDASRDAQWKLLVESIRFAATEAKRAGMSVMLEALNPVDTPRYFLQGTDRALELIRETEADNVRFQLDVYHLAVACENPLTAIDRAGSLIGHVQFADAPGRHEPGTGSLPFPAILRALASVGYTDPIGLEYVPSDPQNPDFGFLAGLDAAAAAPQA
jgi:hydroxypyruvate isomerase